MKGMRTVDPYVGVGMGGREASSGGPDPLVRELLRQHALHQAAHIHSAIELAARGQGELPESLLEALDRETDGRASRRVANMLRAFEYFLRRVEDFAPESSGYPHTLFDPMPSGNGERLTTPALLVLQAILYSHVEWATRERFHEAFSAAEVQARLKALDARHRRFVVALVAHQTLVRQAWNLRLEPWKIHRNGTAISERQDRREVAAWRLESRELIADDDEDGPREIARAIARTLHEFLEIDSAAADGPRLAEAMVLFSLCLEFRHQRVDPSEGFGDDLLARVRDRALPFIDWLQEVDGDGEEVRLVFWQYGHRVMEHVDRRAWHDVFQKELSSHPEWRGNVSYSFDPRLPGSYWQSIRERLRARRQERPAHEMPLGTPGDPVTQRIAGTLGDTVAIRPSAERRLLANLALPEDEGFEAEIAQWRRESMGEPFFRIFELLRQAIEKKDHFSPFGRLRRDLPPEGPAEPFAHGYFPTPLVGRMLRTLQSVKSDDFGLLRLRARNLPVAVTETPFLATTLTLYLPRWRQSKIGQLRGPSGSLESARLQAAEALIARYVAAMVINLEVMLAPARVERDYFTADLRRTWDPLVELVLAEGGHQGILSYLEQYRFERCQSLAFEALTGVEISDSLPEIGKRSQYDEIEILGIDIGGSAIKCGFFDARIAESPDGARRLRLVETPLHPAGSERFLEFPTRNIQKDEPYADAQDFARHVLENISERAPQALLRVRAIGVAWPGAVRDQVTAAASGILRNFPGFTGHSDDDPRAIRKLDFKDAFSRAFAKVVPDHPDPERVTITVLNDGDADVRSDEPDSWQEPGVSAVLKAGTGTACGIFVEGRAAPLLAEFGKVVLDLMIEPLEKPRKQTFPPGTANKYCSKSTLPTLARVLGWTPEPPLDTREIAYFHASESARDKLKARIGREVVFRTFEGYFGSPDAIEEELPPALRPLYPDAECFSLTKIAEARIEQLRASGAAALEHSPIEGVDDVSDLAGFLARLAGLIVGDAIALLVQLVRCRAVRLGGGPWSPPLGGTIAEAASERLRRLYGLEVDLDPEDPDLVDPHVLSEIRQIRLFSPREHRQQSGAQGAARAALQAFVAEEKRQALVETRDYLTRNGVRPFSFEELRGRRRESSRQILRLDDLQSLVASYAASLRLQMRPGQKVQKSPATDDER